ncbi:tumor necrosis factor receptor superfamily member 6 isoform X2 [Tachysurus vachellii]|uniref:tumor necrosis factor receptor superfamily member 6 isoform X2 n=1 Tax=Tachysurus vachellii TaxID=175792 RepID=UPI00296AD8E6|nr:tumor necrosis factor receptor superfamily member 6 isoform X2 [Tachysurus vachellii]
MMEMKKLLALLCVLWSVVCVTECVWRNGPRRQRRETCTEGLYSTSNGIKCCQCPKGHYLVEDCTSPEGIPKCEVCLLGTYLDHVNHERKCEPCKTCGSNENMEVQMRCSLSSNTVCRCKDGHYCHKGDECKVCYQCSTCEEYGVKEPCTPTNDTQCHEKTNTSQGKYFISIMVTFILIIITAAVCVYFFRNNKMFCFKQPEEPHTEMLLDDPNLEPFLHRIVEILGFKVVRTLVKWKGLLPQATIDNIMDEHPHDAKERAYQLLMTWYQKHGMKGAYKTLCESLISMNMKATADKVSELIQEGQCNENVKQNGNI